LLFKQMAVSGVGLIGGSVALAAKRAGLVETVIGYSKKRGDLYQSVSMGVLDRYYLSLPKAIEGADLIVLATPVGIFTQIVQAILPYLEKGVIVTDVGSIKGELVFQIEAALSGKASFVGGHPMAGRERSGISAAIPNLFEKAIAILTPTKDTDKKALRKVSALWKGMGSSVVEVDPMVHDRMMAAVSHLPHLVAYALMELFAHPKMVKPDPLPFSAGGLRDFTRIAESSPEMWHDIFLGNKRALIDTLDLYQETLEKMKKAILSAKPSGKIEEADELFKMLGRAKMVRQRIRP
jgi:prephenate dehydrogenase